MSVDQFWRVRCTKKTDQDWVIFEDEIGAGFLQFKPDFLGMCI
jgi:hypothetical protein